METILSVLFKMINKRREQCLILIKNSGVDKEEGYKAVNLMKDIVTMTHNKSVLTNLGSFGAMYELGKYENPILVSGTDGIGTKLK